MSYLLMYFEILLIYNALKVNNQWHEIILPNMFPQCCPLNFFVQQHLYYTLFTREIYP